MERHTLTEKHEGAEEVDISTSSPTLLGRGTAKLAALVTWLTGSEPTKHTAPIETTQSTIVDGLPTPVPPKGILNPDTVELKEPVSGSGSTRKMQPIYLMPDNLSPDEAAEMVDYLRGKYGLPFVMDKLND